MYWLADLCVRRPVFAVMLILALVVAGLAAYSQLNVDRFPKLDFPTVFVTTTYPGASPEDIESEVSQILEEAVATVAGIDELRSFNRDGFAQLIVQFNIDRDIDAAAQDVRDAVNSVLNRLPPDIDPPILTKADTDSSPIMSLAVSGPRERKELYVLAEQYVKNLIESAPGVGRVWISGSAPRAVQINVEASRLAAYDLSIAQVREAIVRQNANIPGGRVDTGVREYGLRTLGRFPTARDFLDMPIATVAGTPVCLRDIGTAVDGTREVRSLARYDGQPAVVLRVQRQAGENTTAVVAAIKQRLERSRELLREHEVRVDILQDQSRYIHAAMHEVQKHLIVGSVLASLVVLFFMRSWRSTLIAAVAIPASIIATFAAMRFLNFTLNNVTMLALVLMVGVVIDDAIVVLENVFHLIEEKGLSPREAAVVGTREIGLAVLVTTLSLVIVFLPVSFLSSITGRMLYQFGMTATVAILVSMLVSFSLTPMMCSRLLRPMANQGGIASSRRGFYHWIEAGYMLCLRWSLRYRWIVLALSVAVVAAIVPLYKLVKQDYIPMNVDESEFEINVTAREGTTLKSMELVMAAVEAELHDIPGINHLLTTAGSNRLCEGNVYVQLQDISERRFSLERLWHETLAGQPLAAFQNNFTQRERMTEVRRRLMARMPELRVAVRNLTSLRQGPAVDIDFAIMGPDLDTLLDYSEKLHARVKSLPGITDTFNTLRVDRPELLVDIDRQRAADLGVDVREIADTLRVAVGGDDKVSRFRDPRLDKIYYVELRLVDIDRSDANSIGQLYVRSRKIGEERDIDNAEESQTIGMSRIDNVVSFRKIESPERIDRLDRQRMAAIRGNILPGYALGEQIEAIQQVAKEIGIPPGFSTRVMGSGRELERTFRDFRWVFALSFIFMYLLLAAQFEHLTHPLTILCSLPLAVPFGLISLYLGGESLNLYSALGILVLFGVVKKAAILQVDHTNQLRVQGHDRQAAILLGNRDRLRPILMTTIAFVGGMLPLLFGTGPGAEERRSIAVLAVGGQTLSLLLTLLAVPVVYSILDDLGLRLLRRQLPPESGSLPPATLPHEQPALSDL